MSMIDIKKLRKLAQQATQQPIGVEYHETGANLTYCPHGSDCLNSRHDPYLAQDMAASDAEYFAAVAPPHMLELLDELERHRAVVKARQLGKEGR